MMVTIIVSSVVSYERILDNGLQYDSWVAFEEFDTFFFLNLFCREEDGVATNQHSLLLICNLRLREVKMMTVNGNQTVFQMLD